MTQLLFFVFVFGLHMAFHTKNYNEPSKALSPYFTSLRNFSQNPLFPETSLTLVHSALAIHSPCYIRDLPSSWVLVLSSVTQVMSSSFTTVSNVDVWLVCETERLWTKAVVV